MVECEGLLVIGEGGWCELTCLPGKSGGPTTPLLGCASKSTTNLLVFLSNQVPSVVISLCFFVLARKASRANNCQVSVLQQ
jgi:hypothetical protein